MSYSPSLAEPRPPINPPEQPGRPATVGLMDYILDEMNRDYWMVVTPGERASADYRRAMAVAEGM